MYSYMMLILFGLPGAGKTYIGKLLEKEFGFFFYDGDSALTEEMKIAIKTKTPFTNNMRNMYFERLIKKIQTLTKKQKKLVVSQTFIKDRYRKNLLEKVPYALFFLIDTNTPLREERLKKRTDYPLDLSYTRRMVENFESPSVPHVIIDNSLEGENDLKKQL